MDNLQEFIDSINIIKILDHYGFNTKTYNGNLIRSRCKIHDGDNPSSFVINKDSGLWYCHTNCGGGDLFTLVEKMEDVSFKESVKFLSDFYQIDLSNVKVDRKSAEFKKGLKEFLSAMSVVKKKEFEEYKILSSLNDISSYKDFKKETLDAFKVTLADEYLFKNSSGEVKKFNSRYVFPIFINGKLVGESARAKGDDRIKWLHQPSGIKTSDLLYNIDRAKHEDYFIMVEGFDDVMAYYEIGLSAVATFGSNISESQYKTTIKYGKPIVLSFDGDKAGEKATRKAIEMFKNKAEVYVVDLPSGEDPASIERGELNELFKKKRRVI